MSYLLQQLRRPADRHEAPDAARRVVTAGPTGRAGCDRRRRRGADRDAAWPRPDAALRPTHPPRPAARRAAGPSRADLGTDGRRGRPASRSPGVTLELAAGPARRPVRRPAGRPHARRASPPQAVGRRRRRRAHRPGRAGCCADGVGVPRARRRPAARRARRPRRRRVRRPGRGAAAVGVTGTQGKTTTTRLAEAACRRPASAAARHRHGRHPDRRARTSRPR